MKKLDTNIRVETFIRELERKHGNFVRLENHIDRLKDNEIKFQLQVAVLNHYQNELAS